MNVAEVDKVTVRFNGHSKTYSIYWAIHRMGESEDPFSNWPRPKPLSQRTSDWKVDKLWQYYAMEYCWTKRNKLLIYIFNMKTEELKIFILRNQIQSKHKPRKKTLKLYDCKEPWIARKWSLIPTAARKWTLPTSCRGLGVALPHPVTEEAAVPTSWMAD